MRSLFLLILVYSMSAHAESGWTDFGKVIEMIPDSDFRYRVNINVKENPSGCRINDWFYQDYLSNGSDQMYTAILEALINERAIKVYVSGKCGIKGYSEITAVSIR